MAIVVILATLAIPSSSGRINQKKLQETKELLVPFQEKIRLYYELTGGFPANNEEANFPEANKIIGNYMESMTVEDGALHIELGNKLPVEDEILTIYPVYVEGEPSVRISWVCGLDEVPEGMEAAGTNKTSVTAANLPISCR